MKTIFLSVLLIPLVLSLIESSPLDSHGEHVTASASTEEFAKAIMKHNFKEVKAKSGTEIKANGKAVDVKAESKSLADLNNHVGPVAITDSSTEIKTRCC